ncbi:hypothetical protein PG994_000772 [Apiospora phragmitis]|uniref:Uncharacterized protein n=1 Tax=Apiospora phragmitis TaxID=2905665 RepID=A0ABR1X7D6_9PEZI
MPGLSNIRYSREKTISDVRDYYTFLTKMYLDESEVIEPPVEGWPYIDNLRSMGKTDEVMALLRHLPYIRRNEDVGPEAAPGCSFADWQQLAQVTSPDDDDGRSLRECSEPPELVDDIPSLSYGRRSEPAFLLDTWRGVVHWYECEDAIIYNNTNNLDWVAPVPEMDDASDWAPEREAEWRAQHPAWAVADFFKILRGQFLALNVVPIGPLEVYDIYTVRNDDSAVVSAIQQIYRQHGWPDLLTFRKQDCLRAVKTTLHEEFPDFYVEGCDEEDGGEDGGR